MRHEPIFQQRVVQFAYDPQPNAIAIVAEVSTHAPFARLVGGALMITRTLLGADGLSQLGEKNQ